MFDLPSFEELKTAQPPQKPVIPMKTRTLTPIKAVERSNKTRVAAYCRVSTDHEDQETSFEGQQNLHNSSEDNPLCN